MTRKIVRLPTDWTGWEKAGEVTGWIFENDCYKTSEMLYRHEPWNDGKWHTGPKEKMYAVDFDDPKDAMQFALWIGLGIE